MEAIIPNGTRVRNWGEQFGNAYIKGTATVIDHFETGPVLHIEYVVEHDTNGRCEWPDHRTIPVQND